MIVSLHFRETETEDQTKPDHADQDTAPVSESPERKNDETDKKSLDKKPTSVQPDKKRKKKWKSNTKQDAQTNEQSSRGMSFKRMEAYGMHSEVKRVKKLKSRDKKQ